MVPRNFSPRHFFIKGFTVAGILATIVLIFIIVLKLSDTTTSYLPSALLLPMVRVRTMLIVIEFILIFVLVGVGLLISQRQSGDAHS